MKIIIAVLFLSLFTKSLVIGQEVILIRHAEVNLKHSGWIGAKKAAEYRKNYDIAPVHQFNADTVLAKIPQRITDTVYVSGLPRSVATGLKLFGDSANIVSLKQLNEFEMTMIWLPLYLPYKGWTSISRMMWLLGWEKQDTESYQEARERVKLACDFIEIKARQNQQVILVTHGFINRNISKELETRGWEIIQNEGTKNLGATVLQK